MMAVSIRNGIFYAPNTSTVPLVKGLLHINYVCFYLGYKTVSGCILTFFFPLPKKMISLTVYF